MKNGFHLDVKKKHLQLSVSMFWSYCLVAVIFSVLTLCLPSFLSFASITGFLEPNLGGEFLGCRGNISPAGGIG